MQGQEKIEVSRLDARRRALIGSLEEMSGLVRGVLREHDTHLPNINPFRCALVDVLRVRCDDLARFWPHSHYHDESAQKGVCRGT